MKKYKLYELFDTLSNGELRRLRRFLQSPYVTSREDVLAAFDYLAERRAAGRSAPERELLYRRTFPGQPYDDMKMRATMSDLAELIEQFWLMEARREDSHKVQMELARIYRRRGLERHFRRTMKKVARHLERSPLRDPGHYEKLLAYRDEWLEFQSPDARQQLTIVAQYRPGGQAAAIAMAEKLAREARAAGAQARIVVEPGEGGITATLAYDVPSATLARGLHQAGQDQGTQKDRP